ncbi:YqkE family protein [Ectobacillus polymachus]|uniref:YqkE family protein n=1 Tax=Ectobacillus polymachus TaxID=1508806 RepID=UPI003A856B69
MAKKNKNSKPNTDEALHVSDRIEVSILQQLKDKKKQLAAAEDIRQKQEEERKIRERREREKNKSFEELLNESGLSWKDYK